MAEYKKIPTTKEVYYAILKAHPDLSVFGLFSAPTGNYYGNPSVAEMYTAWGFKGLSVPIVEVETKWDVDPENESNRLNERHKFWLCCATEDE